MPLDESPLTPVGGVPAAPQSYPPPAPPPYSAQPYAPPAGPPLPVLGQGYAPAAPMTWATIPSAVRDARLLSILGTVVFGLLAAVFLVVDANDFSTAWGKSVLVGVYGTLFAVNLWLAFAIRQGKTAAWAVQLTLSVLGLLQFPLGTLIHGLLLSKWFRPEVKAWFGQA